jgi:hypothetical protein
MRYFWCHVYYTDDTGRTIEGGYYRGQWHVRLVVRATDEKHAEHLASLVATAANLGKQGYGIEVGPCQA